jgi:hypothetical protein
MDGLGVDTELATSWLGRRGERQVPRVASDQSDIGPSRVTPALSPPRAPPLSSQRHGTSSPPGSPSTQYGVPLGTLASHEHTALRVTLPPSLSSYDWDIFAVPRPLATFLVYFPNRGAWHEVDVGICHRRVIYLTHRTLGRKPGLGVFGWSFRGYSAWDGTANWSAMCGQRTVKPSRVCLCGVYVYFSTVSSFLRSYTPSSTHHGPLDSTASTWLSEARA